MSKDKQTSDSVNTANANAINGSTVDVRKAAPIQGSNPVKVPPTNGSTR